MHFVPSRVLTDVHAAWKLYCSKHEALVFGVNEIFDWTTDSVNHNCTIIGTEMFSPYI